MLNPLARIKSPILAALAAGAAWFVILFALGFAMGVLRVLVTAPALGALGGVLIELPIMLWAGWVSCRAVIRRFAISGDGLARIMMATIFLVLLMAAEQALGIYGFGNSAAQQWAAIRSPPGLLGLAGQLATASMPLWQGSRQSP